MSSTLSNILKDEYDALVVETEAKVLRRDSNIVASGSFVPLSSIRAIFSEWDAPLNALLKLMQDVEGKDKWKPGLLIDLLLSRSHTGVHRISEIFSSLARSVQCVWRSQLTALVVHGTLSSIDPLASEDYSLFEGCMPSCVKPSCRESIQYIGRAIGTVKAAKWQKQLPRDLAEEHTVLIDSVLPEDSYQFDSIISQIRTNVSEWLWLNVLTQKDVEDAVESLANYFLVRNGEFCLSLIREIERLKLSRLTLRSGQTSVIREQDLNLALLRASLGTTAQYDPALLRLRFSLPSGPLRPILPSLGSDDPSEPAVSPSQSRIHSNGIDPSSFTSNLLGTRLSLKYTTEWPLDLFLQPSDLNSYEALFSYLVTLRKTHTRIHSCWSSLSNAQRARRRWTGLGEGGTVEDLALRNDLLRNGWSVVRDMGWFLDTLLGYMMIDVVDVEYRNLRKRLLGKETFIQSSGSNRSVRQSDSIGALASTTSTTSVPAASQTLDFNTLRNIHASYLDRLLTGCLLTNSSITTILSSIFEVCEQFVARVERWGGDILPALLFEGSIRDNDGEVGAMAKERRAVVLSIDQAFQQHLDAFYEQLSLSITPSQMGIDGSRSMINASMNHFTTFNVSRANITGMGKNTIDVRRHVERLMLRLDFNGRFSDSKLKREYSNHVQSEQLEKNILAEGGL